MVVAEAGCSGLSSVAGATGGLMCAMSMAEGHNIGQQSSDSWTAMPNDFDSCITTP